MTGLVITLLSGIVLVAAGWLWITPARVQSWSDTVPSFHLVFRESELVSTGLEDPYIVDSDQGVILVSSIYEEVPGEYRAKN